MSAKIIFGKGIYKELIHFKSHEVEIISKMAEMKIMFQ